jgi:hypothetical protein
LLLVFFGLVLFGLVFLGLPFVFYRLVIVAGFPIAAVDAIFGGFADVRLRAEFIAGGGVGYGINRITWDVDRFAPDILRGDLDCVESEAGTARVEAGGTKAVEDLGEGVLDGAAILEDREFQVPVGV